MLRVPFLLAPLLALSIACVAEDDDPEGGPSTTASSCGQQRSIEVDVPVSAVEAVLDGSGAIPTEECPALCDLSPMSRVTDCVLLDQPADSASGGEGTAADDTSIATSTGTDTGTGTDTDADGPRTVVLCTYTSLCL